MTNEQPKSLSDQNVAVRQVRQPSHGQGGHRKGRTELPEASPTPSPQASQQCDTNYHLCGHAEQLSTGCVGTAALLGEPN